MHPLNAYAICGSIIASVATWAFLQFPGLLIWGAFIGWASFLHTGGTKQVFASVLTSLYFGSFMAWLFACIVTGNFVSINIPLLAALIVAVMAPIMILGSKISFFSVTPAVFYGFAASFAYLAQTPLVFDFAMLTSLNKANVVFVVPISLTIGACFGYLQVIASNVLAAKNASKT